MTGMTPIDPANAGPDALAAMNEAKAQFGAVINLFKVAANAPNVLMGLMQMKKAMHVGNELDAKLTEQVAMLVSALNRCDYCVNVHMHVGKMNGLSEQEMLGAMAGKGADAKAQALMDYANEVVRNRGLVSDGTMRKVRSAGFSDKALLETVGVIGFYTTLQYIRHVADPAHDFPVVRDFDPERHGTNDGPAYVTA
ncbi:carboxymuconolactone decarboxylase family protein [Nisaea acidiphila]|uniref:Carboxymuconolactone decarboxylase family protein n=1 Tax=Nisaea acidiphila TaxID=1862145 RepID=A0A9J7AT98_9PROT|nr:carboxymuconolactone decarboxylase family protein [Nisaea acidiphila]UUX50915.1 carboxymuconolactone decarboxylase family protein [Nisaea acidiphila]